MSPMRTFPFVCSAGPSANGACRYAAAKTLGTGFKLFMSFDMSVLGCNDAAPLRTYITTYAGHPNQLTVDGKVFASTFGTPPPRTPPSRTH
jgi:hypothetical protein